MFPMFNVVLLVASKFLFFLHMHHASKACHFLRSCPIFFFVASYFMSDVANGADEATSSPMRSGVDILSCLVPMRRVVL